jgi:hypothetical protein
MQTALRFMFVWARKWYTTLAESDSHTQHLSKQLPHDVQQLPPVTCAPQVCVLHAEQQGICCRWQPDAGFVQRGAYIMQLGGLLRAGLLLLLL